MARGKRDAAVENRDIGEGTGSSGADVGSPIIDPAKIDAASDSSSGEDGGGNDQGSGTVRYNKDGSIRKKRGPNKARSATAPVSLDVHAVQFSLSGIHSLLAIALSAPEMELSEQEAEILAKNAAAVARHYDIVATQKSVDWFNLIMAGTTIYGSRMIVIGKRKASELAQKRQNAPRNHPGPLPTPSQVSPVPGVVNGPMTTRKSTPEDKSMLDEIPLVPPGSMQSH